MRAELRQLGRSKTYEVETQDYQPFVDLLTRSGIEEAQRLGQLQARLLKVAEVIPLTQNTLVAFATYQAKGELSSPQDALIYTHLIQHLDAAQPTPSCFITKNYNDFSEPDIEKAFLSRNCKLLYKFKDGYNYVHRP